MKSDFDKADEEAGSAPSIVKMTEASAILDDPSSVVAYRDNLVKKYHKGATSLLERMEKDGCNSSEALVMALVREVISESDHLHGNELIASQNGNIRDSSVISGKRSEVLLAASKAIQAKQALEKEGLSTAIDVDSPSMVVVFKYFLMKVKTVFSIMQTDDEMSNTFFRTWKAQTEFWKKELKAEIEANINMGSKESD